MDSLTKPRKPALKFWWLQPFVVRPLAQPPGNWYHQDWCDDKIVIRRWETIDKIRHRRWFDIDEEGMSITWSDHMPLISKEIIVIWSVEPAMKSSKKSFVSRKLKPLTSDEDRCPRLHFWNGWFVRIMSKTADEVDVIHQDLLKTWILWKPSSSSPAWTMKKGENQSVRLRHYHGRPNPRKDLWNTKDFRIRKEKCDGGEPLIS